MSSEEWTDSQLYIGGIVAALLGYSTSKSLTELDEEQCEFTIKLPTMLLVGITQFFGDDAMDHLIDTCISCKIQKVLLSMIEDQFGGDQVAAGRCAADAVKMSEGKKNLSSLRP